MDLKERLMMRRKFVEKFTALHYDMRPARDDASRFFTIVTQAAWETWQDAWAQAREYDPDSTPNPFAAKTAPTRTLRKR